MSDGIFCGTPESGSVFPHLYIIVNDKFVRLVPDCTANPARARKPLVPDQGVHWGKKLNNTCVIIIRLGA